MKEESRRLWFWIFGLIQSIILVFLSVGSLEIFGDSFGFMTILVISIIFAVSILIIEWLIYSKK